MISNKLGWIVGTKKPILTNMKVISGLKKLLPESKSSSSSSSSPSWWWTETSADFFSADRNGLKTFWAEAASSLAVDFVGDGVRDRVAEFRRENSFDSGERSRQLPNLDGLPMVGDCDDWDDVSS